MSAPYFNGIQVDEHDRFAGYTAGSASLQQFQLCGINSSGELINPAADGDYAVVLDDAPSLSGSTQGANGEYSGGYVVGQNYGVVTGGIMKVIAGTTLAVGDQVMANTSGQAIVATSGNIAIGFSLGAAASGDYCSIRIAYSNV